MMDWIKVEHRLPKSGERILIYWTHRGKQVPDIIDYESDAFELLQSVTHWRPLPPPPGSDPAPDDELTRARAALAACGISGIYDEFADVADALAQMAAYIRERDRSDEPAPDDERHAVEFVDYPFIDGHLANLRAIQSGFEGLKAADVERRALGDELIAWAADEGNLEIIEEGVVICVFCAERLHPCFQNGGHEHGCFHLRARKLQERGDE